jgi:hypothetical protein
MKIIKNIIFAILITWIGYFVLFDKKKKLDQMPSALIGHWTQTILPEESRESITIEEKRIFVRREWVNIDKITFNGSKDYMWGNFEVYVSDKFYDFLEFSLNSEGKLSVSAVSDVGEDPRYGTTKFETLDLKSYIKTKR